MLMLVLKFCVVIYGTKSNYVELDTIWRLPHETVGLFGLMALTVRHVKLYKDRS
jgi:hypothetical protein